MQFGYFMGICQGTPVKRIVSRLLWIAKILARTGRSSICGNSLGMFKSKSLSSHSHLFIAVLVAGKSYLPQLDYY